MLSEKGGHKLISRIKTRIVFYFIINLNLIFREGEGKVKKRVREKHQLVAFCTCPRGLNLQPRRVPQPGIKPATFQPFGVRTVSN